MCPEADAAIIIPTSPYVQQRWAELRNHHGWGTLEVKVRKGRVVLVSLELQEGADNPWTDENGGR